VEVVSGPCETSSAEMIAEVDMELGFGIYRRRCRRGFDWCVLRECANHEPFTGCLLQIGDIGVCKW
jgi:hypothetical protein